MKKMLLLFLAALLAASASAQARYGYIHYDSLLVAMPAYGQVQQELQKLRSQYEAEAEYNEMAFKRQFAEFLQGQKDFPQNILLKRQRDLQDAMERGLAYRAAADSLLQQAAADLLAPVQRRLDEAITTVGLERGYEFIVNLDDRTFPFVHPQVAEDAMPYVREKLED